MRVDACRHRVRMPREPLGQEEIPGNPVDIRNRGMSQGVEGIEPIEPGHQLPTSKWNLDPPL